MFKVFQNTWLCTKEIRILENKKSNVIDNFFLFCTNEQFFKEFLIMDLKTDKQQKNLPKNVVLLFNFW